MGLDGRGGARGRGCKEGPGGERLFSNKAWKISENMLNIYLFFYRKQNTFGKFNNLSVNNELLRFSILIKGFIISFKIIIESPQSTPTNSESHHLVYMPRLLP